MGVKMYECDHCGWQSNDMDAVLIHLRDSHGIQDLALDPDTADWHVVDLSLGHDTPPRQAEGD